MNIINRAVSGDTSKVVTLHELNISRGQFRQLLESIVIRELSPSTLKPSLSGNSSSVRWMSGNGGVCLETSHNPSLVQKPLDLTVIGTKVAIDEVVSILTHIGVPMKDARRVVVSEADLEYHMTLNPVLWSKDGEDYTIKEDVASTLLAAGKKFIEFLKVPDATFVDITLTGSSCNYNWTDTSDIDLHVVADMGKSKEAYGELLAEYFDAKKRVWNDLHNITIKGIPVEFYVQDMDEKHHSTGIYSLQNGEWVNKPTHNPPTVDDIAVKEKTAELIREIDDVCSSNKADAIEKLHAKLVKMRKQGLEKGGEFATGNVVFKQLRSKGYLDKLSKCKVNVFDRALSIEDEEWVR